MDIFAVSALFVDSGGSYLTDIMLHTPEYKTYVLSQSFGASFVLTVYYSGDCQTKVLQGFLQTLYSIDYH